MSCPPIPLFVDAWNTWAVDTVPGIDAEDVADWLEALVDEIDGTEVHDITIGQRDGFPADAIEATWRRTECDPMPKLDGELGAEWVVRFVARGAEQPIPIPEGSTDSFLPQFAFRTEGQTSEVPEEPPSVLERIGDTAKKAVVFSGVGQLIAGVALAYLAYKVYTKEG